MFDLLLSFSHRSERRGRRPHRVGELRSGGRPHRRLQTKTGSAGTGGWRNQTPPGSVAWTVSDVTGLVSCDWLSVCRRRSSVWPSSPSRRNRDSLSAPSHRGSGAPSSSEPRPPHTSTNRSPAHHLRRGEGRGRRTEGEAGETCVLQLSVTSNQSRLSRRVCGARTLAGLCTNERGTSWFVGGGVSAAPSLGHLGVT